MQITKLVLVTIAYACVAIIFECLTAFWVRSWIQGADTRIPFYSVMPILFGITLTGVDRWVKIGPLIAVCVGALAGAFSSAVAIEVVRLIVIGADRYGHGWKMLGWYSEIANVGLGSFLCGVWVPGGIGALGRYVQSTRFVGASARG